MMLRKKYILPALAFIAFGIAGCSASGDDPGVEYAPQMYHSVAYAPLSQIQDENAGGWLSNREDEKGEFHNSNPYNPNKINMRTPPANTVRRTSSGMLPYRMPVEEYDRAGVEVTNPFEVTDEFIAEGQVLYNKFCQQCHGANGQAAGKVGEVFLGVPAYNVGRVAELTEGNIFHTITLGRGRMGAHGSQIQPEDRWKIVSFVQTLQKQ
ncbi:c-type cytochrome [Peijinzhouia sedimentorum]